MASQWVPPLPPGYEARWDPNQRAYFFINHRDKSTSWQDPRFAPAHQSAAQFLNQPGYGGRPQGAQNIPMQTKTVQFGSTTSTEMITTEDDQESESETDFDTLFASSTGDQGKKVDIQKLHKVKQMFPSAPEDIIKELLLRNNNVEHLTNVKLISMGYKQESYVSHPPPRSVDMLERLHAMFPSANKDLVKDILSQANHDEKKARIQLEAIGYKATYPSTHKDSSRSTSPARGKSPSNQTSPAKRSTSPAKPKLSEAEKIRLENKIKQMFPKIDKSVVEMALQSCNYDESRSKAVLEGVLERMADTASKPSSSRPGTSASSSRTRSVSPKPAISHNLEPVVLFDDTSSRPSTTSSGKKSRSTTPSGSRPQSKSRSPTPKSNKSSTQQQRAKQVTQMSEEVLSSTIETLNEINSHANKSAGINLPGSHARQLSVRQSDTSGSNVPDNDRNMLSSTLNVLNRFSDKILVPCCGHPGTVSTVSQAVGSRSKVTSSLIRSEQGWDSEIGHERTQNRAVVARQPRSSGLMSEHRTPAKGPDPSLRVGPNKDLLLTEYTQAKGPNPELRQGPDPSRVQGSQGAMGPDRSLHCGPQMDIQQGPASRQVLVSAI